MDARLDQHTRVCVPENMKGYICPETRTFACFRHRTVLVVGSPLFSVLSSEDEVVALATRAADFVRLYRMGYHHKPGDFRELGAAYYSVPEAAHAAGKLNGQRHARGVARLDTI